MESSSNSRPYIITMEIFSPGTAGGSEESTRIQRKTATGEEEEIRGDEEERRGSQENDRRKEEKITGGGKRKYSQPPAKRPVKY